ncbi:conserved unknown protein [Ectocarpus siliculosus]|uniref:Uncharacterized protein n=1 Tax=Ectocarpus siliculosus TaxID=2880 RepID=D7G5I0_ECTSI|nr:conserved unknown protein [Ectocarpus siliculosus]|eukprot:CBJ27303.1 conserved unknown protein [Ectocarpus siliculosus]
MNSNNRVQLFDATTSKFLASVGRRGQIRPGRMQGPEGVAFVDGRREMIVADTGNSRLQIFHVEELADPLDDPGIQPDVTSSSSSSSSSGRGAGELQRQAANFEQGPDDADGDDGACLLVFAGGEDAGGLRQRRVAGESEDAEGPLSQPCDVAYWRPRRTAAGEFPEKGGKKKKKKRKPEEKEGEVEDTTTVWAWNPEPPRWFWPNPEDEERARRELLSPASPPRTNPAPTSKPPAGFPPRGHTKKPIDRRSTSENESSTGQFRVGSIKGGGTGEPTLGAFVVCATGVAGKLQLSFIAKTKEAEEAEHAAANGSEPAESEDESFSSLSGRRSTEERGEDDSSEGFEWMRRVCRNG